MVTMSIDSTIRPSSFHLLVGRQVVYRAGVLPFATGLASGIGIWKRIFDLNFFFCLLCVFAFFMNITMYEHFSNTL